MGADKSNVGLKVKMYILSLWLLFFFFIISTFNSTGLCAEKIDWRVFLLSNIAPLICVVLLTLCVVFYYQFKYDIDGTPRLPVKVIKVHNCNSDYMAFLATYIMPLIFLNFASDREMVIIFLLLVFIGIMYVKTDMFLSNPTLALLGYKIYKIQTDNENIQGIMISKSEIKDGENISCVRLGNQAYFIRKVEK